MLSKSGVVLQFFLFSVYYEKKSNESLITVLYENKKRICFIFIIVQHYRKVLLYHHQCNVLASYEEELRARKE